MSTIHYCDTDDCQTDSNDPLYWVPERVADILVKRGWFMYRWDIHICKYCVEEYYNEEDEQLKIIDDNYIELGKDFDAS